MVLSPGCRQYNTVFGRMPFSIAQLKRRIQRRCRRGFREVAVIYAGNIIEYGTKQQIFDYPTHPYTIGLFGAIPNMNEDEEWLHHIDGLPPDPTNLPAGCAFSPRCPYVTDECQKSAISVYQTPDGHDCRCCNINAVLKGGSLE